MILRRNARPAFTLIETSIAMWGLGMALAFGSALIVTAVHAWTLEETTTEQFGRLAELGGLFRVDVARAEGVPGRLGEVVAGPQVLILQLPGGSTVVYRKRAGMLERIEHPLGKDERARRFPLSGPDGTIDIVSTGKLVTLRVVEPRKQSKGRITEFSAMLGGDRR